MMDEMFDFGSQCVDNKEDTPPLDIQLPPRKIVVGERGDGWRRRDVLKGKSLTLQQALNRKPLSESVGHVIRDSGMKTGRLSLKISAASKKPRPLTSATPTPEMDKCVAEQMIIDQQVNSPCDEVCSFQTPPTPLLQDDQSNSLLPSNTGQDVEGVCSDDGVGDDDGVRDVCRDGEMGGDGVGGPRSPDKPAVVTNTTSKSPTPLSSSADSAKSDQFSKNFDEGRISSDEEVIYLGSEPGQGKRMVKSTHLTLHQIIHGVTRVSELTRNKIIQWLRLRRPVILDIFKGRIPSQRHKDYFTSGKKRAGLVHCVDTSMFTCEGLKCLHTNLLNMFCSTNMKYFDYVMSVLVPECVVRLIADIHDLSFDEAERTMYKYSYDSVDLSHSCVLLDVENMASSSPVQVKQEHSKGPPGFKAVCKNGSENECSGGNENESNGSGQNENNESSGSGKENESNGSGQNENNESSGSGKENESPMRMMMMMKEELKEELRTMVRTMIKEELVRVTRVKHEHSRNGKKIKGRQAAAIALQKVETVTCKLCDWSGCKSDTGFAKHTKSKHSDEQNYLFITPPEYEGAVAERDATPPKSPRLSSHTGRSSSRKRPSPNSMSAPTKRHCPLARSVGKTSTKKATPGRRSLVTPYIPDKKKAGPIAKDQFEIAKHRLYVSAVSLPCREDEFATILTFVVGKLRDRTSGCMYISGVPGTGKTATVHEITSYLQTATEEGEIPQFQFVEVNGMRLTDPHQAYVSILKQLTGERATASHAANLLDKFFSARDREGKMPIVLLADELDLLWTRKQTVLYNLFDWPSWRNAHLIVLAVANTMDLPERMKNKVSSRLGLTRLTFHAYTFQQLQEILTSRMSGLKVFEPDTLQLAARKVAAVSGDARRALDICWRATELAQQQRGCGKGRGLVRMSHVDRAVQEMFSSIKIQAIKHASLHEKMFLRAVLAEFRRTGLEETSLKYVSIQLQALFRTEGMRPINHTQVAQVCSNLGACRLLLVQNSRMGIYRKIRLNVSQDDVIFALRDFIVT